MSTVQQVLWFIKGEICIQFETFEDGFGLEFRTRPALDSPSHTFVAPFSISGLS